MDNWFTRFALWWSRLMSGRHGTDQFSLALFVLYCVLMLFSSIFGNRFLFLLSIAALAFCIFRMMSRNQEQRWKENSWFLGWWNPFWHWMRNIHSRFRTEQDYAAMKARDHDVYRYFRCPKCRNKLRVPKGKGKIVITCPVCHTDFMRRT